MTTAHKYTPPVFLVPAPKIQKQLAEPIKVPGTDEKVSDLVIIHDPSKCTGCNQCMIGCAYKHYRTFDRRFALLYVNESPNKNGFYVNANCQHCVFPMCLASCPKEAIYKDEKGIVRISPMLCVGCGTCNQACPIGIPRLDDERKIYVKCDFCDGEYPMCFQMCSTGALRLMPRKEAFELVKKLRSV
ncbi:MAG TPA: 4Fe-4S dicluster domain-containing protein [Candidatus Methanomethylicus sp.]|nr:4Fe-4S dicluster domain-containing protein [Candidatus Methanomethylicus sp.]